MPRLKHRPRDLTAARPDCELVLTARAGDNRAAGALCRRHRNLAYRVASRLMRGPDREDLSQDAFLAALGGLDRIANPEVFPSWLATVVVRTAAQTMRREHRRRRKQFWLQPLPERPPSAEAFAELQTIDRMLARVPPEARAAF